MTMPPDIDWHSPTFIPFPFAYLGVSKAYGGTIEELEDAQLQLQTLLSMRHVTPFRDIVQVRAYSKMLSFRSRGPEEKERFQDGVCGVSQPVDVKSPENALPMKKTACVPTRSGRLARFVVCLARFSTQHRFEAVVKQQALNG